MDSEPFNTLLVALVFLQFFEGIALGTRINDLNSQSLIKPIIMGTLLSVMAPVGNAIDMGVRRGMNPASAVLAQAILINHSVGFRKSSMGRKAFRFLCMYVGAGIMAVLGIWT
ncbi:hypothetical protein HPULCUR_008127 [Helicostylum pulchrum]|uniref:Uncharacterized protein n=1 Tax=Helicostylum pulchrum TaxID=562976 RepID=A0ABP9Y730_9FUNG